MLLRFRQDAVALRPSAVLIHAGINDIGGNTGPVLLEDIKANLASMTEIAYANGVRVILTSVLPPPHRETPLSRYNFLKHPPDKALALNSWLKEYSTANGCHFADYGPALRGSTGHFRRDFSEDGLHPTPAGYSVMAPLTQAAIDHAFG
jgi:lysophospholipase L1-like esterase